LFEIIKTIINKKKNADILIIGKGASIDQFDYRKTESFLKICVNDSDNIINGDFCVFRHEWVCKKINKEGPKSSLYITNQNLNSNINSLKVDYNNDLITNDKKFEQSILSGKLCLDKGVLFSALRLAFKAIELGSNAKRILLVGFDFTTQSEISSKLNESFHFMDQGYENYLIQNQKDLFIKFIKKQSKFSVSIQHVGYQNFSIYTPDIFNRIFLKNNSNKKNNSINNRKQINIVAEITTNHFGDSDRLKSMIYEAASAGANYIKLQKRDVNTFYTKDKLMENYNSPFGKTFGDYRHALELNIEQFKEVESICNKIGIKWFASILDIKSFKFIQNFNPSMIKLPSTISQHQELLNYVAKNFTKDVIISTGYENDAYQSKIINLFKNCRKLFLLQCTSSYPTPRDEVQIGVVRHYYNLSKKYKNLIPGFSSHDMGSLGSMLAIAAGAIMVEKHVKLGCVDWSHFDDVALDLINGDFKKYVNDLRMAELMVGSENKKIQPSEHHKYFI
jgi:N-acetylneuraminate synthase